MCICILLGYWCTCHHSCTGHWRTRRRLQNKAKCAKINTDQTYVIIVEKTILWICTVARTNNVFFDKSSNLISTSKKVCSLFKLPKQWQKMFLSMRPTWSSVNQCRSISLPPESILPKDVWFPPLSQKFSLRLSYLLRRSTYLRHNSFPWSRLGIYTGSRQQHSYTGRHFCRACVRYKCRHLQRNAK